MLLAAIDTVGWATVRHA